MLLVTALLNRVKKIKKAQYAHSGVLRQKNIMIAAPKLPRKNSPKNSKNTVNTVYSIKISLSILYNVFFITNYLSHLIPTTASKKTTFQLRIFPFQMAMPRNWYYILSIISL